MSIDPLVVVDAPLTLFAVIGGVIAIKALVIFLLVLAVRQPLATAVESALMLCQIGEFSLVGLALAGSLGVVPVEVSRILVVAAGLTMLLTSALSGAIHRLVQSLATELLAVGADAVVLGAFEASLQLGEETLVALGFPREPAHATIGEKREETRRELADAAASAR